MDQQLLTIVQSDYGFNWNFTLQDAQGIAQDISDSNLYFNCQLESDLSVNFRNPMTVLTPSAGTCLYTVQENDFLVAGTYTAQIVVEYLSGQVVSFAGITIKVLNKLPVE